MDVAFGEAFIKGGRVFLSIYLLQWVMEIGRASCRERV